MIEVEVQKDRYIYGKFNDLSAREVTFRFEGTYKMSFLRIKYKAPQGQKIMEDGSCFLKLQSDGNFIGYYANFDGCGKFQLIRIE